MNKTKELNDALEEIRCAITNIEDGVGWKRHWNRAQKIVNKVDTNIFDNFGEAYMSLAISWNKETRIQSLEMFKDRIIDYMDKNNLKIDY